MEEENNDDDEGEETKDFVHAFIDHEGAYHHCKCYGSCNWTMIIEQQILCTLVSSHVK
jgi:hypothetical protein